MTAIILAVASAAVWGTADFSGGKSSQRASALVVATISKLSSLPFLALYLILLRGTPNAASLAWGAVAGVVGVIGIFAFYRALGAGAMAVVAPVSAVTSAVVPLAVGLVIEKPPGAVALTGVCCAIVAIALVSMAPRSQDSVVTTRLLALSIGAGVAFGLFFVALDRASTAAGDRAGLWPIAAAQVGALALCGALLLRARSAPRLTGRTLGWAVVAGVLDMTANALYLLAVQHGSMTIVAPLASLYPVSTVLLALFVDRERVRPIQLAGLGLAATALVLVAS